eukprot:TRINITY_DN16485_c0_g1_i1.p1 TRINITY_DN16485_c0_g1~~TRINITY_DN16485_c0_g1_i1.p1  ORF type:complete len:754 (+),score=165.78 TRINITY_DN16485_c0_g1_i1:78-2264(+)
MPVSPLSPGDLGETSPFAAGNALTPSAPRAPPAKRGILRGQANEPEEEEEDENVLVCGHCRGAHSNARLGYCDEACQKAWHDLNHSRWLSLGRHARVFSIDQINKLPDCDWCLHHASNHRDAPVHAADLVRDIRDVVERLRTEYARVVETIPVPRIRKFDHLNRRSPTGQLMSVQVAATGKDALTRLYAAARRWQSWAGGVVRQAAQLSGAEVVADAPLKPVPAAIRRCDRTQYGPPLDFTCKQRPLGSLTDVLRFSLVCPAGTIDETAAALRNEALKHGGRVCTVQDRFAKGHTTAVGYHDIIVLLEGPLPQRLVLEVQLHAQELWQICGDAGRHLNHWAKLVRLWERSSALGLYTGARQAGVPHGTGTLHTSKSAVLRGEFAQSRLDAKSGCSIAYPNGDAYYGGCARGFPHGYGLYRYDRIRAEYEGQWHLGVKHGAGTYRFKDGAQFRGEYVEGEEQGEGEYRTADGERYEGQYARGQRNGWGTVYFRNGHKYTGNWSKGVEHGMGRYHFASGTCDVLRVDRGKPADATGIRCTADRRYYMLNKGIATRQLSLADAALLCKQHSLQLPDELVPIPEEAPAEAPPDPQVQDDSEGTEQATPVPPKGRRSGPPSQRRPRVGAPPAPDDDPAGTAGKGKKGSTPQTGPAAAPQKPSKATAADAAASAADAAPPAAADAVPAAAADAAAPISPHPPAKKSALKSRSGGTSPRPAAAAGAAVAFAAPPT